MHTGDLATMDEEGYCNIVGRIKDMVIRGGENVYPREIEEFLYAHPDVADVQVVGVPDERFGEELCAWVVAAEGADARRRGGSASSAAGSSPTTRCRATSMFADEFPMTVTGKVQKFKMRERRDRAARARGRGGGEERVGRSARRGQSERADARSFSTRSHRRAQDLSSRSAGSSERPMSVSS